LERDRKAEHIELALEQRMQVQASYFDDYMFGHIALPELDYAAIDPGVEFLGRRLKAPLLVSSMTGGTGSARMINRNLAAAAEACGIAFGVGSQRKAIEDPAQAETFAVRDVAPTIPILANLGAVQLNYGFGLRECERAVGMVEADALVFHLNPLQEAIQPEGQRNFDGLIEKMGAVARQLEVPVMVKEIGCGISADVARRLADEGITLIDTAGSGGTSWARIEAARADDHDLGELFAAWGIPTPESIQAVSQVEGVTVIGSGGIRTGLDVAKGLALGAHLAGLASPFLRPALESSEAVVKTIEHIDRALRIAMFCVGAPTIESLRKTPIFRKKAS
jgi:isopentenyl-diphosphate delta-isomerase